MREPHPVITELRTRRQKAGLSQATVANQLRISRPSLNHRERGYSDATVVEANRYAALFGLRLVLGEPSPDPFRVQLRALREARGLTQEAVADLLGIDPRSLCRRETGKRIERLRPVSAYAALFGLALELREVPDAH